MTDEDALTREQIREIAIRLLQATTPDRMTEALREAFAAHDARQREEIKRLTQDNRRQLNALQLVSYIVEHDDGDFDRPDIIKMEAEQYGIEGVLALRQQLALSQAVVAESETYLEQQRRATYQAVEREHTLKARVTRLEEQLNTPEILDFAKAVNLEAAHQRERWGTDHDGGKTDADWFWLVGYLAGKALHLPEKRLHHLITCAAALANWHLYSVGKSNMRPGIDPPQAIEEQP